VINTSGFANKQDANVVINVKKNEYLKKKKTDVILYLNEEENFFASKYQEKVNGWEELVKWKKKKPCCAIMKISNKTK
jgi:hypothetical protein